MGQEKWHRIADDIDCAIKQKVSIYGKYETLLLKKKRGEICKVSGYIDNVINALFRSLLTLLEFYKEVCNILNEQPVMKTSKLLAIY